MRKRSARGKGFEKEVIRELKRATTIIQNQR